MRQTHPIADAFALLISGDSPRCKKGVAVQLEEFCRLIQREAMKVAFKDRTAIKAMLDATIAHQLDGSESAKAMSFKHRQIYVQTVAVLEDPNLGSITDVPDDHAPRDCGFVDPAAVARGTTVGDIRRQVEFAGQ